ncbi:DUF2249 domain-containing protein [Cupriavidus basilensis]|uniref:DUF2249 domain-containing protein n=1 Tax=Cupriavidus basilensis TaxID=68895 RepID=A0ABT6AGQ0_9BURK|nr:DUF2249 domain-containing protein [Cupriavidus basilensis]MDF3831773.1 DUF2249 domain-containing protein [Cupriavidus basilensis]
MQTSSPFIFDARGIAKRFRHAAIFGALEALGEGESMRFVNDHDPLPLIEQLRRRYQDQLHIAYVQRADDAVVIDFTVHPAGTAQGCGSANGTGCGCSGG